MDANRRLGGLVTIAALPVTGPVAVARRGARRTRRAVGDLAVATTQAVLESPRTEQIVDLVMASPLAERALGRALEGPLVEALSRDIVRYAVMERVTEVIVAGDALESVLDRAVGAEVPQRIADRILADGIVEETVRRIVEGPELERAVAAALESPGMERLMVRVMESRLLDEAVERLLAGDELWVLVQEIAYSPQVLDAISRQGVGFADQVAGGIRARSRRADAWLERAARRALRRRPAGELPPGRPLDPS